MMTIRALVFAVAACALGACSADKPLPPLAVEELFEKHLAALGERSAIDKVRTWRALWRIDGVLGPQGIIERSVESAGRVRIVSLLDRDSTMLVFDGLAGWRRNADGVSALKARGMERLSAQGHLDDLLACRGMPGCRMELAAPHRVRSASCYGLKLTWPAGTVVHAYLDAATFRILRTSGTVEDPAHGPIDVAITFSGHRPVGGGIVLPSSMRVEGQHGAYTLGLRSFEVNVALEEDLFSAGN